MINADTVYSIAHAKNVNILSRYVKQLFSIFSVTWTL